MEALQLASAKRDAQTLVAVKKLCLAYTKYNNDNDEIKKLLPMNELAELDAMDTRLIEDPVLLEKFVSWFIFCVPTKTWIRTSFVALFSLHTIRIHIWYPFNVESLSSWIQDFEQSRSLLFIVKRANDWRIGW